MNFVATPEIRIRNSKYSLKQEARGGAKLGLGRGLSAAVGGNTGNARPGCVCGLLAIKMTMTMMATLDGTARKQLDRDSYR